jgi:uncharacterized protein YcbX
LICVSALHIYPVKSAGGVAVDRWPVDDFGLSRDRRYMVVDMDGAFMTQRRHPHMALLAVELRGGGLTLSYPGRAPLTVRRPTPEQSHQVEIWGESVPGHDAGQEAATWLASCLGAPCRLVYMAEQTRRPVDADYASTPARVSFADGFPLLLISEASLADLNARLATPVTMARFRPNLVVSGAHAFEEDQWREIQIGDLRFEIVKPCARCVMTTVDPSTGVKGKEPMRTLATYRDVNGAVLFGQNVIHRGRGALALGQHLEVIKTA